MNQRKFNLPADSSTPNLPTVAAQKRLDFKGQGRNLTATKIAFGS